jgi:putative transposase
MYLPDVPCHVIQRGNNREATFFAEQDYQFYLECLTDASRRYGVSIHAYVLMTNHVHLLMTPDKIESISLTMQSLGRRYVQYVNKEYNRTGTLWESRHKASLVQAEKYLLSCCRYIELNPVRAGMVAHPAEYKWTSYRANAYGEPDPRIKPHRVYLAMGATEQERLESYRSLFSNELSGGELNTIRNAVRFSMPTGNGRFIEQIEKAHSRKLGQAKSGRPLKTDPIE